MKRENENHIQQLNGQRALITQLEHDLSSVKTLSASSFNGGGSEVSRYSFLNNPGLIKTSTTALQLLEKYATARKK